MNDGWIHSARAGLRRELRPMLRLAVPVVLAEIGWMTMGLVDTMMVGRVGAEAIGAVSVGSSLFFVAAIFGIGTLLGMDYVVAYAVGSRDLERAHRALHHGMVLAALLSVVLTAGLLATIPHIGAFGVQPAVVPDTHAYLRAISWSLPLMLLQCAFHRYLQAMGSVRPILLIVVSANLVNALADWIFIFGNLGLPAYGAEGAGWATCASRAYMLVLFAAYTAWNAKARRTGLLETSLRFEWSQLAELVRLGFPAAVQRVLEVGVFTVATLLAAGLEPVSLAAHHIALNAAAFMFMVPLGISAAAAVRVGSALGARDAAGAVRSGWTAFFLGAASMLASGAIFLVFPQEILRIFTTDSAVIATGATLLAVAALFQLFDGIQGVATGALRGIGDTRTAMVANLVGHWFIGLPFGYVLGLRLGWGVTGIWMGLCLGLICVAVWLTAVWHRRAGELGAQQPDERTRRRGASASNRAADPIAEAM
jgi:MATE family multidrug resistance protein